MNPLTRQQGFIATCWSRGRVTCMYVFADTEMEARAQGMVGQGVFKIINVEVVK